MICITLKSPEPRAGNGARKARPDLSTRFCEFSMFAIILKIRRSEDFRWADRADILRWGGKKVRVCRRIDYSAGATSTRQLKKVAPPPRSVSRSDVNRFRPNPSMELLFHRTLGVKMTPGFTSSETTADL
jgi:hypothetical protein